MDAILVTGGAGFLGSWFVRHWLAGAHGTVIVLDKLTYAGSRTTLAAVAGDPRLIFCQGDIADRGLVSRLLNEHRPWAIVNFAAETHVDRSIDAPSPFVDTNVVGTWQLVDATRDFWRELPAQQRSAFRFLQISTDEVFGPIAAPGAAVESSPYQPSSPYAASKAAADHFVRSYHRTYGLPVLLIHPSNCYGIFQFPEKLIPLMILNAAEGKPLPVYGDGRQTRDWLWGGDLATAVERVLRHGAVGAAYNVAAHNERTNIELISQLAALVDAAVGETGRPASAARMMHVADRPGHDVRYALDTAQLRQLGWAPQMALNDGLRETVAWFLENRAWVAEATAKFDRSRRLGQGGLPS